MYSIELTTSTLWKYTFTTRDFSSIPTELYRKLITDIQQLLISGIERKKVSAKVDIVYSKDIGTHVLRFETSDGLLGVYVQPQGVDIQVNRVGMKRYCKLITELFQLLRASSLRLSESKVYMRVRVYRIFSG